MKNIKEISEFYFNLLHNDIAKIEAFNRMNGIK